MKTFLRWAVGIILLITAISVSFSSILAAVIFLIGAAVALPPTLRYIETKSGFQIPSTGKYLTVLACFIIGYILVFKQLDNAGQAAMREKEIADSVAFTNLPKYKQDSILHEKAMEDSLRLVAKEERERTKKIQLAFSAFDGSHRGLENLIEKNMNDPDSYEHIETNYWDMGDHLVVQTKFRGANAFGGKVVNTKKAKVDLDGNVLEIIE